MATLKRIKGFLIFTAILIMIGIAYVAFQVFLIICPAVFVAWLIYMSVKPKPLE